MSVKKKIKPGRIEASADGHCIVVHFTTEITHLDEDGVAVDTEKVPDKREVNVAKNLRSLQEKDIPAFAQDIVEKCRYIPASKTRQVEQVLSKLMAGSPVPGALLHSHDFGHGVGSRGGSRGYQANVSRGYGSPDDMRLSRMSPALEDTRLLSEVLPEASISNMDDYADELYEEQMEAKTLGAQRLLRICTEVRNLEEVSAHSTLLGVLSRELRENAKRSHELTVAITGIFLCLANFSKFHPVLVGHQCNDVTMRVVEYESRRRTVLTKEIELKRGRLVALGSQASGEESLALSKEEGRYRALLDRQDRLIQLCLLVLRNLTEDNMVEKLLVGRRICKFLIRLLDRTSEDLLLVALSFLHKLVAFEENKDQLIQQAEALIRLAELAAHPSAAVALLAMRVCYNVSFDPRARHIFTSQTSLLGTVVAAAKLKSLRKFAMKLLYHLTMGSSGRAAIAERWVDCITLALQLVVNSPDSRIDRDATSICVNLAAHPACARVIVEQEFFPRLAVRAVQFADPLLLKVLRHLSSHRTVRSRLLEVLAADRHNNGASTWLHELVVLSASAAATPELLLEAVGILANLECTTPEVPWPDLIQAGLLELLQRLLMMDYDDDMLLESIMLVSVLALDPASASLLAASKVPSILPELLTDKQEDYEILLQLLFALRCLLLDERTCEVLLRETDVPDRLLDLLTQADEQTRDSPAWQVIQASAEENLELIIAADSKAQWSVRIKAFRFEIHNDEWCGRLQAMAERPQDMKSAASGTNSGANSRSWMHGWTDMSGLEDRCWGNMPGAGLGDTPEGLEDSLE